MKFVRVPDLSGTMLTTVQVALKHRKVLGMNWSSPPAASLRDRRSRAGGRLRTVLAQSEKRPGRSASIEQRGSVARITVTGTETGYLKLLGEAGRDKCRRILVWAICKCGKRCKVRRSQVASGHVKSCGCLKHRRYVEHMKRTVSRLSQETIMQCFLHLAGDKNTQKPDLPWDVIRSAYYRRTEQLNSMPEGTMAAIKVWVLRGFDYAETAAKTGKHRAEIAWLAKHLIRPQATRDREERHRALVAMEWSRMGRSGEAEYLSKLVAPTYLERKRLQQLEDDRFSAGELHNPDTKANRIARLDPDRLDYAWHWVKTKSAGVKLSRYQQGLIDWFRDTTERTERYRKQQCRTYLRRTCHRVPSVSGRNSQQVRCEAYTAARSNRDAAAA